MSHLKPTGTIEIDHIHEGVIHIQSGFGESGIFSEVDIEVAKS